MFATSYYHETIRNHIVAFGNLFNEIKIQRKDNANAVVQTIKVPLAYGPKDKSIVRTEEDPNLKNQIYTIVPRMTFEILGYAYDSTRKTNKLSRITCDNADGTRKAMFAPTPYNITINMYVVTKNSEDGFQIIEQILPLFSPEYTLSIKAVPAFNLIQDTPIILDSVSVQDDYDGDFQTRRFVTHTLSFTIKLNLFSEVSTQGVIKTVNVPFPDQNITYTASQANLLSPIIESWIDTL